MDLRAIFQGCIWHEVLTFTKNPYDDAEQRVIGGQRVTWGVVVIPAVNCCERKSGRMCPIARIAVRDAGRAQIAEARDDESSARFRKAQALHDSSNAECAIIPTA